MCVCSSRERVCSYRTALEENGCADIVSHQLRDLCSYWISACSEAITSRDPLPIVPHVWAQQYGRWRSRQFTEGQTNVPDEDYNGRLFLMTPKLNKNVRHIVLQNLCFTVLELACQFPRNLITARILHMVAAIFTSQCAITTAFTRLKLHCIVSTYSLFTTKNSHSCPTSHTICECDWNFLGESCIYDIKTLFLLYCRVLLVVVCM